MHSHLGLLLRELQKRVAREHGQRQVCGGYAGGRAGHIGNEAHLANQAARAKNGDDHAFVRGGGAFHGNFAINHQGHEAATRSFALANQHFARIDQLRMHVAHDQARLSQAQSQPRAARYQQLRGSFLRGITHHPSLQNLKTCSQPILIRPWATHGQTVNRF